MNRQFANRECMEAVIKKTQGKPQLVSMGNSLEEIERLIGDEIEERNLEEGVVLLTGIEAKKHYKRANFTLPDGKKVYGTALFCSCVEDCYQLLSARQQAYVQRLLASKKVH